MRARLLILGLLCSGPAVAASVKAQDYQAFWLWAGVKPQPVLEQAQTLYVLQGQIDPAPGGARLQAQGVAAGPVRPALWLVYRAHTLDWPEAIFPAILARIDRWERHGSRVQGVQIDFDAATRHLDRYAEFLTDLRQRLPSRYRLGATGLLDWGHNGDPQVLNGLGRVLDEIVIQTYQGRHSIVERERYLPALTRLKVPFRLGLVQDGQWQEPDTLAGNPWFRGYVVFLLNR